MKSNELCYEIEKLPASEQQTKVSLLACEMVLKMEAMDRNLLATREELYAKKQRLDLLAKRLELRADGTDRIDILEMHIQNLEFETQQARKEINEYRELYLKSICDKSIMRHVQRLCDIIVNSTPDTTIKGDIEELALHISHWFTVSKT
jgi:hypothetical protein